MPKLRDALNARLPPRESLKQSEKVDLASEELKTLQTSLIIAGVSIPDLCSVVAQKKYSQPGRNCASIQLSLSFALELALALSVKRYTFPNTQH